MAYYIYRRPCFDSALIPKRQKLRQPSMRLGMKTVFSLNTKFFKTSTETNLRLIST